MSETAALQGLFTEPPVSPTPPPMVGALRVAAPPPPPRPTPIAAIAIETLLLRDRLVTPDQIAQAMSTQVTTGKSMEQVIRESGWVGDEDLARILEHVNPHAEPPPALVEEPVAPRPVVELPVAPVAPAPVAAPASVPVPTVQQVHVTLRLTNGERIAIASCDGLEAAKQHALELTRQLAASTDWPFLGGRFIRPEAVVSVDLDAAS